VEEGGGVCPGAKVGVETEVWVGTGVGVRPLGTGDAVRPELNEGVGVDAIVGVGVGTGLGVGEGVGEGVGVTVIVTELEVTGLDVASPGQNTRICHVPGPELNPKSRVYIPLVRVSFP
jgi:hypothetical protein